MRTGLCEVLLCGSGVGFRCLAVSQQGELCGGPRRPRLHPRLGLSSHTQQDLRDPRWAL